MSELDELIARRLLSSDHRRSERLDRPTTSLPTACGRHCQVTVLLDFRLDPSIRTGVRRGRPRGIVELSA
jgi:hypothetical protein